MSIQRVLEYAFSKLSSTIFLACLNYHTVQDTLNTAVKHCSKLFSHGLPGAGVLLGDCIAACSAILNVKTRGPDVTSYKVVCVPHLLFNYMHVHVHGGSGSILCW